MPRDIPNRWTLSFWLIMKAHDKKQLVEALLFSHPGKSKSKGVIWRGLVCQMCFLWWNISYENQQSYLYLVFSYRYIIYKYVLYMLDRGIGIKPT